MTLLCLFVLNEWIYFGNYGKMCSLRLKDDSVLVKQDDTCNKIKEIKSMKFQRKSVHDEKYLKSRKYLFNGAVNTLIGMIKFRKKASIKL